MVRVRGVKNEIRIKPTTIAQDFQKSIQHALERHADREARQIDVLVSAGRVTVSGPVHSWTEKQAVLGAAKGTAGVREVEDRLRIEF